MIDVADIHLPAGNARTLDLGMASQTKIHIPLREQLGVDRAVRVMAGRAPLAHRGMLENKRARLFAMAGGASFVKPRHSQAATRLENIAPMRVVALRAIHLVFKQRMMLRQPELGLHGAMAFKTGGGILARVDD